MYKKEARGMDDRLQSALEEYQIEEDTAEETNAFFGGVIRGILFVSLVLAATILFANV